MRLLLAVVAGFICLAPPAAAQDPDRDRMAGLWCVYETLSANPDDLVSVGQEYYWGLPFEGKVKTLVDSATGACATKHKLTAMEQFFSGELAQISAAIDLLTVALRRGGAGSDIGEKLIAVSDTLSGDEYDQLFDLDWGQGPLGEKLKPALLQAGVPAGDDEMMRAAFDVLSLYAEAEDVTFLYFYGDNMGSN